MQTQIKFDPDPYYDSEEWRRLRAAVLERDGPTRQYCGADTLDNLVCCCSWCNGAALNKQFPSVEAKRNWLRQQRKIQAADRRAGRPDRFERRLAALQEARERGVPIYKIHIQRGRERKRRRQQPQPAAGNNNRRKETGSQST